MPKKEEAYHDSASHGTHRPPSSGQQGCEVIARLFTAQFHIRFADMQPSFGADWATG
ncbi:MAG: hypothetical protein LW629_07215 [Burkholderiales bacterium]|jgi:hypothetical protein|nr:hypothetical protein [Burkholderiales bacterium]